MLNLDTHILIHALTGELTLREKKLLSKEAWSISAIVLWEISKLVELQRVSLDLHDSEVLSVLSRVHIWPLTLDICSKTIDFDSDPADELIAATSIIHRVPLLTRDKKILSSRLVPFA
jgi:PIN domain nuclease of toxin-antitoxin system